MSDAEILEQNLPKIWESVRLGDFVESQKGKKPKRQSNAKDDTFQYPYIDIEAFEKHNIKSYTDGDNCCLCRQTDFLMVWDGSRSGLVGKGMVGALGSTLIRINFPGIHNEYAYYFLKSKYLQINSRAKGSGTPHVDPDLLWNYRFPIPPLPEQNRIVAKIEQLFSELDKGIESLKTAREQLKVYRQALLKHAFEGKLTEHLPSRQAGWRDPNFRNISDKIVPKETHSYFAYVLVCDGGRLYKRFSSNLFERINQHLAGHGAKFTKKYKPLSLLHFEVFDTEQEALEREKYFKSGSGREWLYKLKAQQEEKHPTATELLQRIKQEREARYRQQLDDWKKAVKEWSARRSGGEANGLPAGKAGKEGRKPGKPRQEKESPPIRESATRELPHLPKSWQWIRPQDICSPEVYSIGIGPFGSNLKVSDYTDSGVPLIFVRNITRNNFSRDLKFISENKYRSLIPHVVKPLDILVTKMGDPPGDAEIYPENQPVAVLTADCLKFRVWSEFSAREYFKHCINSVLIKKQLGLITKGVAQKKISAGRFKTLLLPLAPKEEQDEIVQKIDTRLEEVSRLVATIEENLQRSEALRQSILKQAFSGKLVPQDPNDPPAAELLKRIAAEKAALTSPAATKKRARKRSNGVTAS